MSELEMQMGMRAVIQQLGCEGCVYCDDAARKRDEACCTKLSGIETDGAGHCTVRRAGKSRTR